MANARINGVRSIELGVHDLKASAEFYRKVWALEDVAADGDAIHLRGTGRDHHVLTLRERPRAALLDVHFSAPDRASVDALHAQAKALGANVRSAPGALPASAGGGYGFQLSSPEGHPISISADVSEHAEAIDDKSRPTKLTHVVLNSAEVEKQTAFLVDVLGFKWSPSTVSDCLAIRMALEPLVCREAGTYRSPADVRALRGLLNAGLLRKKGREIYIADHRGLEHLAETNTMPERVKDLG